MLLCEIRSYLAGQTQAALSLHALSQAALSQTQAAAQALSAWQESPQDSFLPHLLPQQEAKETATTAAKINAIFFIFLLFLYCETINLYENRRKSTAF